MLDSMVKSPTPTRAEASDVANAVYEGADAVMLSAETAIGDDPARVVDMMNRIIKRTESDAIYPRLLDAGQTKPERTMADTIMESAWKASITLPAAAIVTVTTSGSTAVRAARKRPPVPILALTPSVQVARNLALVWGIHALVVEPMQEYQDMEATAVRCAAEAGFTRTGDNLVITAGLPLLASGVTNVMRLLRVEPSDRDSAL
jgi:pyruvate kinase